MNLKKEEEQQQQQQRRIRLRNIQIDNKDHWQQVSIVFNLLKSHERENTVMLIARLIVINASVGYLT